MSLHVITGGGSGIGQALAWELAQRNQDVVVIGRRKWALEKTQQHNPARINYFKADITKESERDQLQQFVYSCLNNLNNTTLSSLTHCSGVIEPIVSIDKITPEQWQYNFAVNVDAPLFLSQSLLPCLQGGKVLHISSGAAHFAMPGWAAYCSSKAALLMLYQCWNTDQSKVSFGSVKPGIVETQMQQVIRSSDNMLDERQEFFTQLKQQGRLLTVETVAKFLAWLLLDISNQHFADQEWDIYDKEHHLMWLPQDHTVPEIDL